MCVAIYLCILKALSLLLVYPLPLSLSSFPGADIELGASTPLMEASQEGHVDIVKFLLERGAKVHAETSTGDTALTYACANGHTLIADILLQCGAELVSSSAMMYINVAFPATHRLLVYYGYKNVCLCSVYTLLFQN